MADQPPRPQKRKPKSSSERGRAFRERERAREEQLELAVATLEREIADRSFLRGVWQAKVLRSRHSKFGSLARLTEEYYRIVRHGVRGESSREMTRSTHHTLEDDPVEFLSRVTHPDAEVGDVVGPAGMVDQWVKYTHAHAVYESTIRGIEVYGPEEDPIVFARLETRVRVTRKTLETMFPHALADEALVQQLIGRELTYLGTTLLRFSDTKQIVFQRVHFGFVEALLSTGITIDDVERLMRGARISPTCTILHGPVIEDDISSATQQSSG